MNSTIRIVNTYVEYRENPLGIDVEKPRFSWILEEEERDSRQESYQIQTAADTEFRQICWDTGRISCDNSIQIPYSGEPLKSRKRYYYRIKVWNSRGMESGWSKTAWWETAFMDYREWKADWITPEYDFQAPKSACPVMRTEFQLTKKVQEARVYVTAKGVYELRLNGKKVGEDFLTPGWTSYNKRILYQTYDVTEMLKTGNNAIGAVIGSGWYKGELGWRARRNLYGGREALILELHVTYEDGSTQEILSGPSWISSYRGPILYAENYHGETYDARLEVPWDLPGMESGTWFGVRQMGRMPKDILRAQECECVKIRQILRPEAIIVTPKGETILDMGQNMTGWIRFQVNGKSGSRVVLSHAEILDPDGNFYVDNLKGAKQRIEYVLKGEGVEVFQPHFTFQGFRYVMIEEFPCELQKEQFEGLVLYSDMERTGSFSCSDELLNQLYENVLWSQKGNFVDIPTDCPQRCERLGWTADIQIFAATAAMNMRIPLFLTKWLRDLAAEQFESGGVPWVVPDIYDDTYAYDLAGYTGQSEQVAAAWGDAVTICPWTLYQHYGDIRILQEQYDSMKRYVDYIYRQGNNPYCWDTGHQLGDWVALDAPYGSFVGATDTAFVATAYYAYSTRILYQAAEIIGNLKDARDYHQLFEKIRAEFQKKYVCKDGSLSVKTQTAIVLALHFQLVQKEFRQGLADELASWLERTNYDLITGFVGTPYICHVLTANGYASAAYHLLMKREYPSWLYQVTKGATTVWEHLDGLKPDGTLWNPRMNSFNHYAYGSVAEWLYKGIAGINICEDGAGFRHFQFAPEIGGGISWAEAVLTTMYGEICVSWRRSADKIDFHLKVPVNTSADIILPVSKLENIRESGKYPEPGNGIHYIRTKDTKVCICVGSGCYDFECIETK